MPIVQIAEKSQRKKDGYKNLRLLTEKNTIAKYLTKCYNTPMKAKVSGKDKKKAQEISRENGRKGGINSWKATMKKYTKEQISKMRSIAGKKSAVIRWGNK